MDKPTKLISSTYSKIKKTISPKCPSIWKQLKEINKNSSNNNKQHKAKIFVPLPYGVMAAWVYHSLLAKGLEQRNYKVIFGLCDHFLPVCDSQVRRMFYPYADKFHQIVRCGECYAITQGITEIINNPYVNLSKYYNDEDDKRINEELKKLDIENYKLGDPIYYKDIEIWSSLFASIVQFARGAEIPKHHLISFFKSAMKLIDVCEKVMDDISPDYVMIFNGSRLTENIALKVALKRNIRTITFEQGQRFTRLIFEDLETIASLKKVEVLWEKYKDTDLTAEEENLLDQTLNLRKTGVSGLEFDYYRNPELNGAKVAQILNIDLNKPSFLLPGNVMWDAALVRCDRVFKDAYSWIEEVVEYFKQHPDKQLIIRPHPAEVVDGIPSIRTLYTIEDLIRDKCQPLPPNVIVVPGKSNISSYALFEICKVVLPYTSTVGIEAVSVGKPVIMCTDIYYANKGFTYEAHSKEEYFDLIENFHNLQPLPNQSELARKLMYIYIYKFGISFPFFEPGNPATNVNGIKFKINSFDELKDTEFFERFEKYLKGEQEMYTYE